MTKFTKDLMLDTAKKLGMTETSDLLRLAVRLNEIVNEDYGEKEFHHYCQEMSRKIQEEDGQAIQSWKKNLSVSISLSDSESLYEVIITQALQALQFSCSKILFIKAVKILTGWGLKESKEFVEKHMSERILDVPLNLGNFKGHKITNWYNGWSGTQPFPFIFEIKPVGKE